MQTNRPEQSATGTRRCHVGIAEHEVRSGSVTLTTSGLGSCVGVCLFDGDDRGGLAHCMLPAADGGNDPQATQARPAKYVDTGIDVLCEELLALGVSPEDFRAKLAGGSDMLGFSDGPAVGERNVAAARSELRERGIPVVAARTGGEQGRSLAFETATGELRVTAADGSTAVL